MFSDRIEGKWITMFRDLFAKCGVKQDDLVCILAETQSRQLNVHLCELGLNLLGARQFKLVVESPRQQNQLPQRSTGTTTALQKLGPVLESLSLCDLILDLTVEGAIHAPELHSIVAAGPRALHIVNEHPEALERLAVDDQTTRLTRKSGEIFQAGQVMRVTSPAGTDVTINLAGSVIGANPGFVTERSTRAHWPGGLTAGYPAAGTVNGTIVVNTGDINCTFKRYQERPMIFNIKDDIIQSVDGDSVDAALFRSYSDAWQEQHAYAVAHVGWGTSVAARWESLAMYDQRDTNCIEARVFAGNFLLGIGASHVAKRDTQNHFDISMRHTTISIDNTKVVEAGNLCLTAD